MSFLLDKASDMVQNILARASIAFIAIIIIQIYIQDDYLLWKDASLFTKAVHIRSTEIYLVRLKSGMHRLSGRQY